MRPHDPTLDTVRIETRRTPDLVVILMHGLGADGHDFEPIVADLALPPEVAIRWVFPHAPVRSVTINGGEEMRAWYDIVALDIGADTDEVGIRESAASIGALIAAERDTGVPSQRILLAGFSQGGVMALYAGLRWGERLAGIAALSCYVALPDALGTEASASNASLPIFLAHGTADPVVSFEHGEAARDLLLAGGYRVTWRTYPMGHGVSEREVADLRGWILERL
jgi:phospholipase/carboxylesterase